VRHGPTHEKNFVGWRDVPADLSDHALIARLNAHLPQSSVLISSDLIRASATADTLASDSRMRLPHDPDLRELDFGLWDGMHARDVSQSHPEPQPRLLDHPRRYCGPEGESWNDAARRINAAVDRITQAHPNTHIIAVAHFGVILTQVQRALGVDAHAAMAHKIDNLSVTDIHITPRGWDIGTINHQV